MAVAPPLEMSVLALAGERDELERACSTTELDRLGGRPARLVLDLSAAQHASTRPRSAGSCSPRSGSSRAGGRLALVSDRAGAARAPPPHRARPRPRRHGSVSGAGACGRPRPARTIRPCTRASTTADVARDYLELLRRGSVDAAAGARRSTRPGGGRSGRPREPTSSASARGRAAAGPRPSGRCSPTGRSRARSASC